MGMSKTYKRRMAATEAFNRVADGKGRGAGAPGAKSPKEKAGERAERDALAKAHNGKSVGYSTHSPTTANKETEWGEDFRFQSRAGSVARNRNVAGGLAKAHGGRNVGYSTFSPDPPYKKVTEWGEDFRYPSRAGSVARNRNVAGGYEPSSRRPKMKRRPRGFMPD